MREWLLVLFGVCFICVVCFIPAACAGEWYSTEGEEKPVNKELLRYKDLGARYVSLGQYDAAIAVYIDALKRFSGQKTAALHDSLGNCYYFKNRYWDAVSEYNEALFWYPNNSEYNFDLGRAHVEEGWYGNGIQSLEAAIRYGKKDAEVYYYLGRAYYGDRQFEKSKEAFEKAIALCKEPVLLKEIRKAVQRLTGPNS